MTKPYTPGPWRYNADFNEIQYGLGETITKISSSTAPPEEQAGNRQLLVYIPEIVAALNYALAELRELCEVSHYNTFDDVMQHIGYGVRAFVDVDMSPVYWKDNRPKRERP